MRLCPSCVCESFSHVNENFSDRAWGQLSLCWLRSLCSVWSRGDMSLCIYFCSMFGFCCIFDEQVLVYLGLQVQAR